MGNTVRSYYDDMVSNMSQYLSENVLPTSPPNGVLAVPLATLLLL